MKTAKFDIKKLIDTWSIPSKNVAILVKTSKDLDFYIKERHYWSKIIAEAWFKYLQTLSLDDVNELKSTLDGLKLLGEHFGNPKNTHIIEYKQIDIILYAIVENTNPNMTCQDPNNGIPIIQEVWTENQKSRKFPWF